MGLRSYSGYGYVQPLPSPQITQNNKSNPSLVTVHTLCYRSRMKAPKCRLCQKHHYGLCGEIDEPVVQESKKSDPRPKTKSLEQRHGQAANPRGDRDNDKDAYCQTCGNNLSARDRKRKRRAKYMKDRRSKK